MPTPVYAATLPPLMRRHYAAAIVAHFRFEPDASFSRRQYAASLSFSRRHYCRCATPTAYHFTVIPRHDSRDVVISRRTRCRRASFQPRPPHCCRRYADSRHTALMPHAIRAAHRFISRFAMPP